MPQHDHAAVGGHIAHAGGGHAAEEGFEAAEDDDVRWADADAHVADAGWGQAADESGDAAGRQNRAADVRNEDRHHRANVHVRDASARHSHGRELFGKTVCAETDPKTVIAARRRGLRKKVEFWENREQSRRQL